MDHKLPYKLFRGFRIPSGAKEDFFAKAADYVPKEGEVIIVSYPKCGTTWVQHIVYLLLNDGKAANSVSEVISSIPFPEQDGFPEGGDTLALKYHLPLKYLQYRKEARYIYVARNPKDACVSYYHFLKKLPGYHIQSFDEFFSSFLDGQLAYGDILEHFCGWYEVRHLPNILFVTYESLSRHRRESILNIANFLGFEKLDDKTLQDTLKHSSFDFMKSLAEGDSFMQKYLKSSTGLSGKDSDPLEEPKMMRKGVVGDWRNYFSVEQSRRMNHYLELNGKEILDLWRYDMDL